MMQSSSNRVEIHLKELDDEDIVSDDDDDIEDDADKALGEGECLSGGPVSALLHISNVDIQYISLRLSMQQPALKRGSRRAYRSVMLLNLQITSAMSY